MKIIITGASGFVGRNLTSIFERNEKEVIPFSLRKENWQVPNAAAIIHLAGIEKDSGIGTDHKEYFEVNSYLTEKIFQQFLISNIRDFIFISSIKAVSDSSNHTITEEEVPNPISSYGKSKLLAEKLICKYDLPKNKRLIILRPCLIHGPEDNGNLKLLYKIVRKGIPYPLGGFSNQRSYLSINNLSFVLLEILNKPDFKSGIYHIADDKPISTNKLIEIMYETLGKKSHIIKLPPLLINFVANLFSMLGVRSIQEKLKKLTNSLVVSNSKIKNELQIDRLPLSTEEGLIKTIKSFKE